METIDLDTAIAVFGSTTVTLRHGIYIALAMATLFLILAWSAIAKARRVQRVLREQAEHVSKEQAAQLARMGEAQSQITARLAAMNESLAASQGDVMRSVNERLDQMSGKLGHSLNETNEKTTKSLSQLQERLGVIDRAQSHISDLAGEMVQLQNILSNKQQRGAFGEGRMRQIVQDGLPFKAYAFQATLSNRSRPDCLINMPNDTPPLVVDAKFPLESWQAMRDAENPAEMEQAVRRFRGDVDVHIKAVADKYLIAGETQDMAFLFVPSESVFAEIHENHDALVQKAHRAKVVFVSPSLLMLSIQVMQSVLKDVRMREQAHLIQREVGMLIKDVNLLDDRIGKLDTHFRQAQKDIEQINISSGKISKRGNRITDVELEEDARLGVENGQVPKLRLME